MTKESLTVHREITPLNQGDCLMIFDRPKKKFDFPLHFHPEYELNLIKGAKGARRIVGDHVGVISDFELVLTGSNLFHTWEQGSCTSSAIHEVTIQFHHDLFEENLLNRNIMKPLRNLLNRASGGVLFSEETTQNLLVRILNLSKKNGVDSYIELLSLLYDLSNTRNQQTLSLSQQKEGDFYNSKKIKAVYEFIQTHYQRKIKLEEIAEAMNMTSISFSRLMKKRTGKTFVEFLNDYRIGCATRMLIESNENIAEIAYLCGFSNLANFNRIFKKQKNYTPSQFKANFAGIKKFY